MKSKWKQIQSWNVGNADGSVEKYTLYEDEATGNIKIENDFGNISIEMERMSGYEFLKKLAREVTDLVDIDSDQGQWFGIDDFDCDHTD